MEFLASLTQGQWIAIGFLVTFVTGIILGYQPGWKNGFLSAMRSH